MGGVAIPVRAGEDAAAGEAVAPARSDWKRYMKNYNGDRRARLRLAGLCVDCGENAPTETHAVCDDCRAERRQRERRRKKRMGDDRRARLKEMLWKGIEIPV